MSFSSNLTKGRIADTIVCGLLKEAGYSVYRFGYEAVLQNFVQPGLPTMKEGDVEAEKIRTMPDFIIMDKEGDVSFIEVKYRNSTGIRKILGDWLSGEAIKHWPEAKLLLVTPEEPFFWIFSSKNGCLKEDMWPLEEDRFIKVDKTLISKYANLVKEWFKDARKRT